MRFIHDIEVPDGPLSEDTIDYIMKSRNESRQIWDYERSDHIRNELKKEGVGINDTTKSWFWFSKTSQKKIKKSVLTTTLQKDTSTNMIVFTINILVSIKNVAFMGDSIKTFPFKLSTSLEKTNYISEISIECLDEPRKRQELIGNIRRKCILWLRKYGDVQISIESQCNFTDETISHICEKKKKFDFSNVTGTWSNQVATLTITPYHQ